MTQRYAWLALALLLGASPALAQTDAAVATVKQYFAQSARYSADDLADLVVTDAYESRRSGATYVYLRQSHDGIEVVNATGQAAVVDGRVTAPRDRFVAGLADLVNTENPSIFEFAAASQAESYLRRTAEEWQVPKGTRAVTDGPSDYLPPTPERIGPDYFTLVEDSAHLVYFVTEDDAVRLAWELELETRDHQHHFLVRVDAVDGRMLFHTDLVNHDHWGTPALQGGRMAVPLRSVVEAPAAPPSMMSVASRSIGSSSIGSYNVFAVPVESPAHGDRSLAANPDDPAASPLGWHDTGTTNYTITRGNNVHAYADVDNNNAPDPSGEPDGGGGLVFDFPIDFSQQPIANQDAAITNLFYWNNIIHDVTYQYGFDEAAGNFQVNNFGNGGLGNDDVRAEAQDGGGTNNANFSTPSDGQRPRMQMYLWNGANALTVTAPPDIAGTYNSMIAQFGAQIGMAGSVVLVDDGTADGSLGCNDLVNGAEIAGNIALVERGVCEFGTKVLNAEEAGAVGAIVFNCDPVDCPTSNNPGEGILVMGPGVEGGSVTIPSYFVARSTGVAINDHLPGVNITADPTSIMLDGDFDNGIITHEYGHGISNRLTGGPNNVSCLGNAEQMGEGWSDWYGLMLTQEVGDAGTDSRGVGTYVSLQPNDGIGIRAAPYSTDQSINDFTYQDTRTAVVPHGIGHVWATIVWEATWELINAHGYDPDIYNAAGTAGNQVMLNLVTEGMKLQPCSPGFVDGRDAILEADTLLYGGAYSELLWAGFARRGLGVFAVQGSSNSNADNTEDFSLPGGVNPNPGASVNPTSLFFDVPQTQSRDAVMTIANTGSQDLTWSLPSPPSWLAFSEQEGTVTPGSSTEVTVTASAGDLPINTYTTTINMTTNDPVNPTVQIEVEMEVRLNTAVEGDMDFPGTHLLSAVYPNPFNPTATFALAVAEAQHVRIELYDVLGRRVATLLDGALAARTNRQFTIDGSRLTSGAYFVRIAGETFAETRRVMLLK